MMTYSVYTDGSCEPNPGPGGYAAIIDGAGERRIVVGRFVRTTNNRMEMRAVIHALEEIREPRAIVSVYSDSQYVVKGKNEWMRSWTRRGWRTKDGRDVLNRDLWLRIRDLCQRHQVEIRWVRGHDGNPLNELADWHAGNNQSPLRIDDGFDGIEPGRDLVIEPIPIDDKTKAAIAEMERQREQIAKMFGVPVEALREGSRGHR